MNENFFAGPATTISEVTSLGVPSVMVPYPYAAGDHQALNAEELSRAGAAVVIKNSDLNAESLEREIHSRFS